MTFFENISFKRKNLALAIVAVLLLAVCYKRAISISLDLFAYQKELERDQFYAKNAVKEIRKVQQRIRSYDKLLGHEGSSIEKVQQGLLHEIACHGFGIRVAEVDEVMRFKHPDFVIQTHRIVLQGGMSALMCFINHLEREFSLAKLASVSFEFKQYDADSPASLYATLLLQNYQQ